MAEPPRKVTYVDVSDYQWPGILTQLQPMYDAGVRVLIIKVTQGVAHLQKHYREVYAEAKRIGFVVTFYHFCTNDNGITQADWCKKNVGDLAIDLPLMMDVEAFTATYFSLNKQVGADVHPVIPFRYGLTDYQLQRLMNEPHAHPYTYEYPEESVMWVIADRLYNFQGKGETIIYSNPATALKALTNASWSEHPLNVAHWKVNEPYIPTAWKKAGKAYTLWQMGVYSPWGQDIDCGRWNEEAYPAPWGPTPPPPPSPATAKMHIKAKVKETGEVFEGDL